jgi:hypothetical protein
MKQTAVEWLIEQLKENNMLTFDEWTELVEKAKAMEKEQIKDAWVDGVTNWDSEKEVEDYIKETFKSEKDFSCVQFILDNKTSSATKCICGKEKWQHTNL